MMDHQLKDELFVKWLKLMIQVNQEYHQLYQECEFFLIPYGNKVKFHCLRMRTSAGLLPTFNRRFDDGCWKNTKIFHIDYAVGLKPTEYHLPPNYGFLIKEEDTWQNITSK